MKAGRPKSSSSKPARRLARNGDTSAAALTDPDVARAAGKSKPRAPRRPRRADRRGLLRAIMANPLLTAVDKQTIQQVHDDGITVADLAALAVYELKIAQRLFERDDIDAKALLVALNKMTSHVAAAAQLGELGNDGAGAAITVTMTGIGKVSTRPEVSNHATPDPVVGDIIDTE